MSKVKHGEVLENYVLMLLYSLASIMRVCWFGLRRIDFTDLNTLSFFMMIFVSPVLLMFGLLEHNQAMRLFLPLVGGLTVMTLFACGFKPFRRQVICQKAIARAGLKAATGEKPKVKAIVPAGEHR